MSVDAPAAPVSGEQALLTQRRAKLADLRATGFSFPNNFRPSTSAAAMHAQYSACSREELMAQELSAALGGRIILKRDMGKSLFFTLQDNGVQVQIYVPQALAGAAFPEIRELDLGDIVGAHGKIFKTKTGELTLKAHAVALLTKAVRPLPDKFHGLAGAEARYRQRYLSLLVDPQEREIFVTRARAIRFIRNYFEQRGYLEIESPILQSIPGGAAARPFVTHGQALNTNFYLRIAQELYLKRMLVGGVDRVFELNRNFRNEGISPRHNPEFTMLEFNAAYQNYEDFMAVTEELLAGVVQEITGGQDYLYYQGAKISFARPFARRTAVAAIQAQCPEYSDTDLHSPDFLRTRLQALEPPGPAATATVPELQLQLFELVAEAHLIQPTFLIDYPAALSPLAKRQPGNPICAERFELFVGGRELVNGFSELNDPELQAELFSTQAAQKAAGDPEAMFFDSDYIRALEHGLPPNAGGGLGIDRLIMLLTDRAAIRDVILFPQLRNK